MRKNNIVVAILVSFIFCSIISTVSAQTHFAKKINPALSQQVAPSSEIEKQNQVQVEKNIEELRSEISKSQQAYENAAFVGGLIFALLCAYLAVFYRYVKIRYEQSIHTLEEDLVKKASSNMKDQFEEIASKKFDELNDRSIAVFNKIEEKHFQYMQITSLKVSGNYDEALEQAGWRGDYKSFIQEPEAYQRILIFCLTRSRNAQKDASHLAAWQWARELLEKTPNYRNMEITLFAGIALKHFEEAVIEYDKFSNKLSPVERDQCEQTLFVALRRAMKPASKEEYTIRLKNLAIKHKDTKDIKATTNFAAFFRDNGQFEDADGLMKHNISRLSMSFPKEDGWERLFNTYIANCIDQGTPEKGIKQAWILLSNSRRPDNVFTCARLAWFLDCSNEQRASLFSAIESVINDGRFPDNDDGTIKSRALLLESQGKCNEAETLLVTAIENARNRTDKWSENNRYYFRSLLAQILLSRGETPSIQHAIDLLGQDVNTDTIGEAQYLMAKACALKHNYDGVSRHLDSAAKIKRKWIMVASRDKVLKEIPVVSELLMQHSYY